MPHVPCRACGLPLCFLKSCASDTAKGAGVLRTGAPAPFCCDAARAAPGHELSGSLRKQAGVSRLQIVLQEGLAPGEAVGIGRYNGHHAAFGPVACAVSEGLGAVRGLHAISPGSLIQGGSRAAVPWKEALPGKEDRPGKEALLARTYPRPGAGRTRPHRARHCS